MIVKQKFIITIIVALIGFIIGFGITDFIINSMTNDPLNETIIYYDTRMTEGCYSPFSGIIVPSIFIAIGIAGVIWILHKSRIPEEK